jgi:hypothetical protein
MLQTATWSLFSPASSLASRITHCVRQILPELSSRFPLPFLSRVNLWDIEQKRQMSEGVADVGGVVFPVFINMNSAINSVSTGLCQGFLGAGSYAFSSKNALRHLHLFRAVCVLVFCYHLALMPIMVFKPQWPSRISMWDKTVLEWARLLIRIPYFTNSLIPLNFAMVNFLLSTKSPMISLFLTLVRGSLYVGQSFLGCYAQRP